MKGTKMSKLTVASAVKKNAPTFDFPTLVCRKISTKEDEDNGFVTYVGQAPIASFLNFPDDENVRKYLMDAAVKARQSGVHKAIQDTLENHPNKFAVLNGGICIVANSIQMQEDQKLIRLTNPSIINGSQTRGVIRDYLQTLEADSDIHAKVKFEIIVTSDSDLADEVSIARNFQIVVQPISIYGKLGYFDEISKRFQDHSGQGREIRTSETDRGKEYIPTEKLIQVITALIPSELWKVTGRGGESWNKAFTYSSSAGPLRLFAETYKRAHEDNDPEAMTLYKFYLDIASDAWELYESWSKHSGFKGSGIKKGLQRDEKGNIVKVMDGLVFPIISAFSAFLVHDKKWKFVIPSLWSDDTMVSNAKNQFMGPGDSNPQTMGKNKGIYQSLYSITDLVVKLSAKA